MEPYVTGSKLIPFDEWTLFLDGCKATVIQSTLDEQLPKLIFAIETAVLERAKISQTQNQKIGVFFSGGIDSTLIAYVLSKHNIPFVAYTVGFKDEGTKDPEDITESIVVAKKLGIEQKILTLTLDDAKIIFEKTAHILGPRITNPITLGVGSVVLAAVECAKKDGITHFFGGLGSEEIFAGYERHAQATTKDEQDTKNTNKTNDVIQEECWAGLYGMWARDLERDCLLVEKLAIVAHTPFLDERVILCAMSIPGSQKIKEHEGIMQKKWCLRVAAEHMGLPKAFAWRPKRAAQYGSRTDSALDKLSKREGMTKKEYCEHFFSKK